MRAVYLAIVLGFFRRLLRKMLVSPGRRPLRYTELCGREYDVWLVMESGCGLVYRAGGPWRVNFAGECRIANIAGKWSGEIHGDPVLSVTRVDYSRMPGVDVYLRTHSSEYMSVHLAVSRCLDEMDREFSW